MNLFSFFNQSVIRLALRARLLALALPFALLQAHGAAPVEERIVHAMAEKKADLRLRELAELGAHLSIGEIAETFTLAKTLKELRERAVLHDAVVKRWSELAPAEAWSYVAKLPESRGKLELIRMTIAAYARKTPARAATAVGEVSGLRSQIEATAIAAEIWAKADVPAALEWTRSLPEGPAREAALYNIRFIWVHSDPVAAASDIQRMDTSDTKKMLIMNIAGEWAARDPAKAIAWARGLQEPSEQEEALFNVAESWADTKPREAGEFALQLSSPLRERAAVAVVARWATQNPKDALEWAVQAALQGRGLSEGLSIWTAVDPEAAREWVKNLDPKWRDGVIPAFVEAMQDWAPAEAAQMALLISDPAAKSKSLEDSLARWREIDPSSMRAWIEAADLSPERKRTLLSGHADH